MAEKLRERRSENWHWKESQQGELATLWQREEPKEPQVGQGWFDEKTNSLYGWDGCEWVQVAAD